MNNTNYGTGVCHCCVDKRENNMFAQHGLPAGAEFYHERVYGSFLRDPANGTSTAAQMLAEAGKSPIAIIEQGHRDCAAVKFLAAAVNKNPAEHSQTERDIYRNFESVARIAQKYAAGLSPEQQLTLLEKACVLQDINNFFKYDHLKEGFASGAVVAYAYYSLSLPAGQKPAAPGALGLLIFDPRENAFLAPGSADNAGIRISDLVDTENFTPLAEDRFRITKPIDLEAAICNEARYLVAGEVPPIEAAPRGDPAHGRAAKS